MRLSIEVVRGNDWWNYKIPPLLAIGYATLLFAPTSAIIAVTGMMGVLLSLLALASFGYVVNDIFDIDEDRLTGKSNIMEGLATWQHVSITALLCLAAFLPFMILDFGILAALVLIINLALPLLYSIPPIRLKERGVLGIIADAAGAHLVPTVFVVAAVSHWNGASGGSVGWLMVTASIWAFLTGLRGILIHQLVDRHNDVKAGANTFIATHDPMTFRRLGRWVLFPAEMLAYLGLLAVLASAAPLIVLIVLAYVVFDIRRHLFRDWPFEPVPDSQLVYIVPAELYEIWLPLGLVLLLGIQSPELLVLAVMHLMLFYPRIFEVAKASSRLK